MSLARGEAVLLFVLAALPALLLAAEATIYMRPLSVLFAPSVAALLLLCLGLYAILSRPEAGRTAAAPRSNTPGLFPLIGSVTALLVLGPRLGLPVFALLFARFSGASWTGAAGAAAVCVLLVEILLVRLLEQPLPLLPLLRWLGF